MKKTILITVLALLSLGAMAQSRHRHENVNNPRDPQGLVFQGHENLRFTVYVNDVALSPAPSSHQHVNVPITPRTSIRVMVQDGDRIAGRIVRISNAAHGTYVVVYWDNLVDVYPIREYEELCRRGAFVYHDNGVAIDVAVPAGSLHPGEYDRIYHRLKDIAFDNDRQNYMNEVMAGHVLTAEQIKNFMLCFSFDDNRLRFAQSAYHRCVDPEDYYAVIDALTFKSNKDKLSEYIHGQNGHHDHGGHDGHGGHNH